MGKPRDLPGLFSNARHMRGNRMCEDSETGRAERKPVRMKNRKPANGWRQEALDTVVTAA